MTRLSEHDEGQVLIEAAKNLIKTVPQLPDIACATQKKDGRVKVRSVTWCIPCNRSIPLQQWEEHTDCQPHFYWRGYELSYTTRVVWRRQVGIELTLTFRRHSAQEREGLRTAGVEGDLQDWKRRTARMRQHSRTLTIAVNRPLHLPQEVAARVQARGPTPYVPSGSPDELEAKILKVHRANEQKRLEPLEMGRRPLPSSRHPILWVNTRTTHKEVTFYLGLYLAQAGMIDEATVHYHLMTHFNVPSDLVTDVWKSVKDNFAYPQSAAGQHAYITLVTKDRARRAARRHARSRRAKPVLQEEKSEQDTEKYEGAAEPAAGALPASQQGVFYDEGTGEEYWTIERTALELNVDSTTVRRWIPQEGLHTKAFLSRRRSGVQKPVTTVLRRDVACLKARVECKKGIIGLLANGRQITEASAQRASRRLRQRSQKQLGREPTSEEILQALRDDPKIVTYHQRQRAGNVSGKPR